MAKELPRIMFMKRRLHRLEEERERRREMDEMWRDWKDLKAGSRRDEEAQMGVADKLIKHQE